MTKVRPILFSTPMVEAILDGRKTQTRRTRGLEDINRNPDDWHFVGFYSLDDGVGVTFQNCEDFARIKCPYGKSPDLFFDLPGDLLYVRETWLKLDKSHIITSPYVYKANCDSVAEDARKDYIKAGYPYQWKPSIHMPKAAARIWLEITDIRVERLQDISEEDALAEGVEPMADGYRNYLPKLSPTAGFRWPTAYHSFQSLWESINGAESWDLNPWLWVVKFKVLSTTGHPPHP